MWCTSRLNSGSQLIEQSDLNNIRNIAGEISNNIITILPKLSIKLLKSVLEQDARDAGLDISFEQMFKILEKENEERTTDLQKTKEINDNPASEKTKKKRRENLPKTTLIKLVESLDDTKDKIFLLRKWTLENGSDEEAISVFEYALNLIITSTEYTPHATVYRELAVSLNSCNDRNILKIVIGIMDSLNPLIRKTGPTVEYIRLLLLLAEAEAKYNPENAIKRFEEAYYRANEVMDLPIKAACMAWIAVVGNGSNMPKREECSTIADLARYEAEANIQSLLDNTGDHYRVLKDILEPLTKLNPQQSIKIALSLNIKIRRDNALFDCVNYLLENEITKYKLDQIVSAIKLISESSIKDEAILLTITRICDSTLAKVINNDEIIMLFKIVDMVINLGIKCNVITHQVRFMNELDKKHFRNDIESKIIELEKIWSNISSPTSRLFYGFNISRDMSSVSKEVSSKYIHASNNLKTECGLDIYGSFSTYYYMLKIAIKAFSGLLKDDYKGEEQLEQLQVMIDRVSSNGEKALLWADIAIFYHTSGQNRECVAIVTNKIKHYLDEINKADVTLIGDVVAYIAPALYITHAETALEMIDRLGEMDREASLCNISEFYFRKILVSEPYEQDDECIYNVSYEEIRSVISLLNKMTIASNISFYMRLIVKEITSKDGLARFTREQKADIAHKIKEITESKLSKVDQLGHCGYRVLISAYLARLEEASSEKWDKVIKEATLIPNASDRCLVLVSIVNILPGKYKAKACVLAKKTIPEHLDMIPSLVDRIEHAKSVANIIPDVDGAFSRQYIKSIYMQVLKAESEDANSLCNSIIDVAYKMDPVFAEELIEKIDDDPARKFKKNAKKELGRKQREKEFINGRIVSDPSSDMLEQYPAIAWKALGLLNAGKTSAHKLKIIIDFFTLAARMPIKSAYPIIYYALECLIRISKNASHGEELLKAVFDGSIISANLNLSIGKKKYETINLARGIEYESHSHKQCFISCGQREHAMNIVKEWLQQANTSYIKICDPYFSLEDIEVVKIIMDIDLDIEIQILTGWENNKAASVEDQYKAHWRKRYSQEPPHVEIYILGTEKTHKSPIHDRWWIFENGGIRFGTSFNSLGTARDSEITYLNRDEARVIEEQLDKYLNKKIRMHDGEKLGYRIFTL